MGYLRVQGLGKAYKRFPTKWARLSEWLTRGVLQRHAESWVLRGISFAIEPGEAVGIIGRNGAGKSTLLKLITGTTQPSAGSIESGGRLVALLELGMGFHPDFTGRQNALMAGQLLGHESRAIQEQLPQIESFAEIGEYIDQPVRTYSSGMQVRLAFSVATAFRPDILIVDEALSVGDAYFQHKCFKRIREFKEQGTTLLFVSHDPGAVKTLCDRALLLEDGLLIKDGAPDNVLDYYNALIAKQEADNSIRQVEDARDGRRTTRSGNSKVRIESVDALENGRTARAFTVGSPVAFRIVVVAAADLPEITVGILLRDRLGNDVFGTNTHYLGIPAVSFKQGDRRAIDFDIHSLNVGVGTYAVAIALHAGESHLHGNYDWWDQALVIQVIPGPGPRSIGSSHMPTMAQWAKQSAV